MEEQPLPDSTPPAKKPSTKPPVRGRFCEKCGTKGPKFADGAPLDLRYTGDNRFLCFRCRAAIKLELSELEKQKKGVEKELKLLRAFNVPNKLDEADNIRLRGLGVLWNEVGQLETVS